MYTIEQGVLANSYIHFNAPTSTAKSLFYYIDSVGHFYCDNNYKVSRKNFDSFLLMYIAKGEGLLTIEDKTRTIKENDVALINCYEPHKYETNSYLETLWIHFDGNVIKDYFNLIKKDNVHAIFSTEGTLIPNYLISIVNLFKEGQRINEPLISCEIQRILAELYNLSTGNQSTTLHSSSFINTSISYINNNFKNKLSLQDIASKVSISPFHFSRLFKKETGYSPYEYIIITRLNHAKKLLKTTNMLIKEIAFECGFNSESNFIINFKKHTSMSPKQFREVPF
ncbi:AraC family transcriptional regulator [Clostridium sp. C8-1-8]|uniref:AraC family transcriptional regulator n=1 Tax=Clostridium sp. C8-1-8 TaxID=2698831 RepID=UPI00136B8194|nr:AraC family transcriptional regulator [Clostridium sp. C8-1-8]